MKIRRLRDHRFGGRGLILPAAAVLLLAGPVIGPGCSEQKSPDESGSSLGSAKQATGATCSVSCGPIGSTTCIPAGNDPFGTVAGTQIDVSQVVPAGYFTSDASVPVGVITLVPATPPGLACTADADCNAVAGCQNGLCSCLGGLCPAPCLTSADCNGLACGGGFCADTVMTRLCDVQFVGQGWNTNPTPQVQTTPIQLTQLAVTGTGAVTVQSATYGPTSWNVTAVGLSDTSFPQGTLTVTKAFDQGGLIQADFYVCPVLTFVCTTPGPLLGTQQVLDLCAGSPDPAAPLPPLHMSGPPKPFAFKIQVPPVGQRTVTFQPLQSFAAFGADANDPPAGPCGSDMDCIIHREPPVCINDKCSGCTTDPQCAGNPDGVICNVGTGMCGGCSTNADCAGAGLGRMCNTTTKMCGGCASNADCPAATPACDANGTCVGCVTSANCTTPGLPTCNTAKEVCVQCVVATDCSQAPTAQLCSGAGTCVPEACTLSSQCPDMYYCNNKQCIVSCCGPGQHAETVQDVEAQPALAAAHQYAPNGCMLCAQPNAPGMDFPHDAEASPPGWVPPSATAATGISHVVEVVNATMAIYDKTTGAQLSSKSLQSFFASVLPPAAPTPYLVDPVVVFDDLSNRFVIAAIFLENVVSSPNSCDTFACDSPQNAKLLYAVSNTFDPTAGFSEMHAVNVLEAGTGPAAGEMVAGVNTKVGYNADAHVITVNQEGVNDGTDDHVDVITITKSSVLDGNPATFTSSITSLPTPQNFAMAPAIMHGSHTGDPMWFVEEAGFGSGSAIRVVRMNNVLASPSFTSTDIPVTHYVGAALVAIQPTVGQNITADDTRVLGASFRGGRLLATQNIGTASLEPKARWYEINTTGASPTLTQQATIDPGTGVDTYFLSVDISLTGALGFTYLQSGLSQYMSMYIAWQQPPPMAVAGVLDGQSLAKAGVNVYSDFTGSQLTGDYSGISADPTNPEGFCAANEYATTPSVSLPANWGTWITCFSNP